MLGEKAELTLSLGNKSVTVFGAIPRPAETSPLTEESVKARLMKMGSTEISLSEEDISLTLGENINLAPSEINSLRRDAAAALTNTERESEKTEKFLLHPPSKRQKRLTSAYFYDVKALAEIKKANPSALSIFDKTFIPLFKLNEYEGDGVGVAFPPVIFDSELDKVKSMLGEAKKRGISDALISNISHKAIAEEFGFNVTGDFRLNVTNSLSGEQYRKMGIDELILSPELTTPMARDIGGSVIVYGRIPLMLTERCFIKENFGCDRCGKASLTDRTGAKFPMIREFEHRNLILNSTPTYMGDRLSELRDARLDSHHFIFTVESAKEILDVISAYKEKRALPFPVRRMGKR